MGNNRLRPLSAAVLLFVAYGAVLTCISFPEWGLDAWRDAAVWYYAGFYFIGINIARIPRLGGKVWRAVCGFWVAALLWGVAETLSGNALSGLSPVIPWRDVPVLASPHSDLLQNMALGSILVLCAQPVRRPALWENLLCAIAVAGMVLFLLSYGRGIKVGLGLGILCVIALNLGKIRSGQFSARLYRLLALGVIALILIVTALGLGFADIGHLGRFEDVSLSSEEGSVYWRLIWWRQLVEELFARNPLFGLGFGESLGVYNPYLIGDEDSPWLVSPFGQSFSRSVWAACSGGPGEGAWRRRLTPRPGARKSASGC